MRGLRSLQSPQGITQESHREKKIGKPSDRNSDVKE